MCLCQQLSSCISMSVAEGQQTCWALDTWICFPGLTFIFSALWGSVCWCLEETPWSGETQAGLGICSRTPQGCTAKCSPVESQVLQALGCGTQSSLMFVLPAGMWQRTRKPENEREKKKKEEEERKIEDSRDPDPAACANFSQVYPSKFPWVYLRQTSVSQKHS